MRWHERYFRLFVQGFKVHGITDIQRVGVDKPTAGDLHVLFGPNYWKTCEKRYKNFLQVNRKFIGDVNDDVAISWNGFNGRGIFNVDEVIPGQLESVLERNPIRVHPWRERSPERFLLLGQADVGRAETWDRLSLWYQKARDHYAPAKCVFRPHPNGDGKTLEQNVRQTGFSVSLNSTVAVETLMLGHPTIVWDEGSPIWSVCGPGWSQTEEPKRGPLLEYLAMCQYQYSDIALGVFWEQLKPGPRGPRLCDVTF
jgi:hypothetical protein